MGDCKCTTCREDNVQNTAKTELFQVKLWLKTFTMPCSSYSYIHQLQGVPSEIQGIGNLVRKCKCALHNSCNAILWLHFLVAIVKFCCMTTVLPREQWKLQILSLTNLKKVFSRCKLEGQGVFWELWLPFFIFFSAWGYLNFNSMKTQTYPAYWCQYVRPPVQTTMVYCTSGLNGNIQP